MTGQAAGTAAAMCVRNNLLPEAVEAATLKKNLIEDGVYLD